MEKYLKASPLNVSSITDAFIKSSSGKGKTWKERIDRFTPFRFSQFLSVAANAIVIVVVPCREYIGEKRFLSLNQDVAMLQRLRDLGKCPELFLLNFHDYPNDNWLETKKEWNYRKPASLLNCNHFHVLKPISDTIKLKVYEQLMFLFAEHGKI